MKAVFERLSPRQRSYAAAAGIALISLGAGSRPKALRTHSAQCLHVNVQPGTTSIQRVRIE